MNDEERARLERWCDELVAALECDGLTIDIDLMLGVAGEAAHAVLRPAAPLTTFAIGFAAGCASVTGTPPADAVAAASETARRLSAEASSAAG